MAYKLELLRGPLLSFPGSSALRGVSASPWPAAAHERAWRLLCRQQCRTRPPPEVHLPPQTLWSSQSLAGSYITTPCLQPWQMSSRALHLLQLQAECSPQPACTLQQQVQLQRPPSSEVLRMSCWQTANIRVQGYGMTAGTGAAAAAAAAAGLRQAELAGEAVALAWSSVPSSGRWVLIVCSGVGGAAV
jgi:hypothetical protein